MELFLEALMILSLCIAVGIMLYRFAANKTVHRKLDRVTVITMGLGFLAGAICRASEEPVAWTFVLYVIGAYLCYTAALFSFPEKEGKHE